MKRPLLATPRRNPSSRAGNVVFAFPSDRTRGSPRLVLDPTHPLSLSSVNLWNIIKNCVGKDLSKIPIPVNFSEPLSMLQRVTEELEYSSVLDMAAKAKDNWEQLAYVAAFTISSYSTTATRVNKPFNPLLGETFECDRTDDFGWRAMSGEEEETSLNEQNEHFIPRASQPSSTGSGHARRRARMDSLSRIHHGLEVPRAILECHPVRLLALDLQEKRQSFHLEESDDLSEQHHRGKTLDRQRQSPPSLFHSLTLAFRWARWTSSTTRRKTCVN